MFKSASEAKALVEALAPKVKDAAGKVDVGVTPPFTSIEAALAVAKGSKILVGAQNCHIGLKDGKAVLEGAYTGEISPKFLKEAGCAYVILGHSERRQSFGETDEGVNQKAKALRDAGLLSILCVGETLDERDRDQTIEVVAKQVKGCLYKIPAEYVKTCVIAYEPVWAIGTGRTATPAQAQEVHAAIRNVLQGLYSADVAQAVRIQYGGSMKPDNAKELLSQPDIDGGLIGGASLKPDDFAAIIAAAM
jgi:triosephosphate isomerase